MTRDETKALLQKIQVHWWRFYKDMPQEYIKITLDEWYRFLSKYRVEYIVEALDMCILSSDFPPSVHEIVSKIPDIERRIIREKQINQPKLEHHSDMTDEERAEAVKKMKEGFK